MCCKSSPESAAKVSDACLHESSPSCWSQRSDEGCVTGRGACDHTCGSRDGCIVEIASTSETNILAIVIVRRSAA